MATKRTRRARNRRAEIPGELIDYFRDAIGFPELAFFMTETELRAAWNQARDKILTEWIEERPGSRPAHWWKHDAPRQPTGNFPGWYYDGCLPAPRRRLGGAGTPSHEVLNYVPSYTLGIPDSWVSQWQADYYNGRARDVNGKRIGTEYEDGHFAGLAINPEDPPAFESEPTYLQRLGLLLPGERERLSAVDFEPEAIEVEAEPDEDEPPPEAA